MKQKSGFRPPLICSLCGRQDSTVTPCETGYVCEPCSDRVRQGHDNTSKAVRLKQRSMRGQAQQLLAKHKGEKVDESLEFDIDNADLRVQDILHQRQPAALTVGGEVLPQRNQELADTMAAPGVVALDASATRMDLISMMGNDIAALALDTAESIQAGNSLEKMLSHQLAVAHKASMEAMSKAALEPDPVQSIRLANLATRLMDTYQRGLLTLKRLRGAGEQRIMVQHVHVADGGQAVVGSVQTGSVR